MERDVLQIDQGTCIDRGVFRETCPFSAVVCAFTIKHHYEIIADRCQWCGDKGKEPCDVYCPVPGAIVPAKYDDSKEDSRAR